MKILLLGGFANYDNRVVKRYSSDGEYVLHSKKVWGPYDKINFKERDNISTEQVVNVPNAEDFSPDYLLAIDENNNIVSRWYVIESYNTRKCQYRLSLMRDIISDHWNEVMDSAAVISRGWTNTTTGTDTPIYNSEGFSVSQIKKDEIQLKDKTGSAWVVGFMKNAQSGLPASITWRKMMNARPEPAIVSNILDNDNGFTIPRKYDDVGYGTLCQIRNQGEIYTYERLRFTLNGQHEVSQEYGEYSGLWTIKGTPSRIAELSTEYLRTNGFNTYMQNYYHDNPPYHFSDELEDLENTYFIGPNDRVYKLKKKTMSQMKFSRQVNSQTVGFLDGAIRYAKEKYPGMGDIPDNWDKSHDVLTFYASAVQYSRDYVSELEQTVDISTNRARLNDRPWSMCAMPFDAVDVKTNQGNFTTQRGIAEAFASKFTEQVGENCIDVQLLPYCPIPDFVDGNGNIDLTRETEGSAYSLVKNGSTKTSILLWARESSAHINIPHIYVNPADPLEFKVEQETKLYRLTAPNYSSAWEFSPAKNNGVGGFDVDFTYEPNGSYMRVAPRFGGLYGQDFGDSRGLIISTNLSLPRIDDNWVNYQLQNANYQKVFDRQVKTQEIGIAVSAASVALDIGLGVGQGFLTGLNAKANANNKLAMNTALDKWNTAMTQNNGVDTAYTNELWGKYEAAVDKWGADVSAVRRTRQNAAFTMTGVGVEGINDVANFAMQIRALEDAKFNHEMNIANIKAQPQTITQIGAFNINNKLFPVLEVYDATESEKDNIREFIKYRSMNIGRTATIREYLSDNERTWIEAALIDTFNFVGDAHELAILKSELQKGVYIYNE